MKTIKKLLLENKAWIQSKLDLDPQFFNKMKDGQSPLFFWIGCVDSRVIPSEIVNVGPGDMFIHTNIANQMNLEDLGSASALIYAIEVLKVPYIIICGHTQCGGIKASLSGLNNTPLENGPVDHWIKPIRKNFLSHQDQFNQIKSTEEKETLLCELNVRSQVSSLAQSDFIINSWKQKNSPQIHGWIYEIEKGKIREVTKMMPPNMA